MEAILLKNQIYLTIEKLTPEQLLLVSDFVSLMEKALPQFPKNVSILKKTKSKVVKKPRSLNAIHEMQKTFQEAGINSLVNDAILERSDRI